MTAATANIALTGVSTCADAARAPTCVGTADESRTVIGYDANGNVTSVERRDGTGALSATSAMHLRPRSAISLTVDGPLSGTADTTRFRYNAARQLIGVDRPRSGRRAAACSTAPQRTIYDGHGLPTAVERGSVASQSDSDWAAFSPARGGRSRAMTRMPGRSSSGWSRARPPMR